MLLLQGAAFADPFADGRQALKEGRYQRALQHFAEVERAHPFLLYYRGLAHSRSGDDRRAARDLSEALSSAPDSTYVVVKVLPSGKRRLRSLECEPLDLFRASVLTELARVSPNEKALELLQEALDLAPPAYLQPRLEMARTLARLEKVGLAAHYYQSFLEGAVSYTSAPLDVMVWGQDGFLVDAKSYQWLRLRVDRQGQLSTQGGTPLGIWVSPRQYGLTIDARGMVRAYTVDTDEPQVLGQLRRDGVSKFLNGYTVTDPQYEQAWNELSRLSPALAKAVGDSPFQNLSTRQAALEALPENDYRSLRLANLLLAQALMNGNQAALERAGALLTELAGKHPEIEMVQIQQAAYLGLTGKEDEYWKALQRLKGRQAFYFRFRSRAARQDWPALLAAVKEFEERYPHDGLGPLLRAEVLLLQDQVEAAQQACRPLELVEADYLRLRLLARQGQFSQQIELLESLLERDLTPYRAQRMLADLYSRIGKAAEADQLRRSYLESGAGLYFEPEEYAQMRHDLGSEF